GKWPAYLPDSLPSVADIGIGSPCGIEFGTRSHFPERWRRALFIADWAYGRILAVHLQPRGASYTGTTEPFLSGRPLNVTDLTFGSDGAMYVTTGGRGTRSGLYRVSFVGPPAAGETEGDATAAGLRALRKKLEALQTGPRQDSVSTLWPHLGHADRFIRHAARVALECQPFEQWQEKAFAESETDVRLNALLALSRVAPGQVQPRLFARLQELPLATFPDEQKLLVTRIYALSCMRMGRPPADLAATIARELDGIYPAGSRSLNHELCRLLIYLGSPRVVAKTTGLLASSRTAADLLHYLFHLRIVREGWTLEQRRIAFAALQRAERQQGARDYLGALRLVRKELTEALAPEEREALAGELAPTAPAFTRVAFDLSKYQFRKAWTLQDFAPEELAVQGSAARGREAFAAAQCVQCHRAANEPGGSFGPDLTGVAARFGRRELLEHILDPAKVIDDKFRNVIITLKDATIYAGAVEHEDESQLVLSTASGTDETIEIAKANIAERAVSPESPMPAGLLNMLDKAQIFDLLAYLESGGAAPAGAHP
nr:c-type cytochrome [Verrucomicrobiota bacterium]